MVKKRLNCKRVLSDLAVEFSVTQQQIKDSKGKVKKKLEKERDKIVEKYKKQLKECK